MLVLNIFNHAMYEHAARVSKCLIPSKLASYLRLFRIYTFLQGGPKLVRGKVWLLKLVRGPTLATDQFFCYSTLYNPHTYITCWSCTRHDNNELNSPT